MQILQDCRVDVRHDIPSLAPDHDARRLDSTVGVDEEDGPGEVASKFAVAAVPRTAGDGRPTPANRGVDAFHCGLDVGRRTFGDRLDEALRSDLVECLRMF